MGLGGFLFSGRAVIDTDLPDKKNILGNLFWDYKKSEENKVFSDKKYVTLHNNLVSNGYRERYF